MIEDIKEQAITELSQRFSEDSKINAASLYTLKNKFSSKHIYSDGSVYVGRNREFIYNSKGEYTGMSKGIPFIRTTKKRHEK